MAITHLSIEHRAATNTWTYALERSETGIKVTREGRSAGTLCTTAQVHVTAPAQMQAFDTLAYELAASASIKPDVQKRVGSPLVKVDGRMLDPLNSGRVIRASVDDVFDPTLAQKAFTFARSMFRKS